MNCDMISGAYANGGWRVFKTVPVCEWSCLAEDEDVKGELKNENSKDSQKELCVSLWLKKTAAAAAVSFRPAGW